ncbi:fructose-bisphospatase I [Besnoitia besnoiti]|uniref:fructose-bisphosphatase n=1 Tax=Besnoitia besnoiti TaxID=94643 RepID=A0A2A9MJV9_BESBE|nr:fructose-bisphospatase I [Besnoitia besnoiti]PFH35943.1 fructose-bisphospatase I [Besnoitia besnoiti]
MAAKDNFTTIPLTSKGSICIPNPPQLPPLFNSRVQLELGEYVVQQAPQLKERGVSVHEISQIFTSIKLAAKVVNKIITKQNSFGLDDAAATNEDISDLANIANKRFLDAFTNREVVAGIATMMQDEIIPMTNCNEKNLVALIHPMDGTKQVDVNVSSGTIFSVYKRVTPVGTPVELRDFLQPGKEQVCAGYVLYGSSTIMVITLGSGVHGFTLDPSLGSFFLSHMNIRIPEDGKIYAINGGKINKFPYGVRAYIDYCQSKAISCRYIGSLVADFHRNMLKGGIYIYPPTFTDPTPSVSMIFQCFPLAFLTEQAGGKASDGFTRILLIEPVSLRDRVAFFCGSSHMVDGAEALMARYKMRDGGWCFQAKKPAEVGTPNSGSKRAA